MLESWSRLMDAPFARVNHQAIFLNGCLYVFGGFNSQLRNINYNSHQLDVFRWNVHHNKWEELKYPLRLKAWSCNTKTWTSDPLSSPDGSINPTLRFGHTVVAWRGRGWLFGGRTQQHVCPNQLYLFEPGYYSHLPDRLIPGSPPPRTTRTKALIDIIQPCWAEVVGTTGVSPSPRDGHAAAVLENAMFIFGGFQDVFGSYDNFVYRFDFITWSWTHIQIHSGPCIGLSLPPLSTSVYALPQSTDSVYPTPISPQLQSVGNDESVAASTVLQFDVPLPRDFSCLISHQGRIFLFGGRSELAARSGFDVYDSALWELVPLKVHESTPDGSDHNSTDAYCYTPVWPDECEYCSAGHLHNLAAFENLQRMAWEEETGNWVSQEFWATAPPRPCCLWKFSSNQPGDLVQSKSLDDQKNCGHNLFFGCRSRWSTGNATWIRRHPGHGLQLPDRLLLRLCNLAENSHVSQTATATATSPHGRRSLSHWAYGGYLYISFGTVRCQTAEQWQLHYQDVWRYSLSDNSWTKVTTEQLASNSLIPTHWPSSRRRAVASLYLPCPSISDTSQDYVPSIRPLVYVFGGTQPRVLDKRCTISYHSTRRTAVMTAPARPYTLFTSGIPSVSSPGEPVTQNRLLGLGDGDSISLLNLPIINSTLMALGTTIITSPMTILLVNSPRMFHMERSTPFYLIMIVPTGLSSSFFSCGTTTQRCQHLSALSHMCVVSFAELAALFRTPLTGVQPLDTMCYGSLDKLLYTNESDPVQLYTALRLAWSAVLTCGYSHDEDEVGNDHTASGEDVHGGSRLHMLIVQQQQQLLQQNQIAITKNCTADEETAGDHPGLKIGDPMSNLSYKPTILEQHCYVLAPDGHVFRETSDCMKDLTWFTLLPLVCSALITTVDLLLESTRRLLACLRQGNLHSFVRGPLVFRGTATCPDCSADELRPVHVWIDSSQLTGLIPVREEPSHSATCGRPRSQIPSDCRHQTIASLLIQFLPHLRSTLELEFATKHFSDDSGSGGVSELFGHALPSTGASGYNDENILNESFGGPSEVNISATGPLTVAVAAFDSALPDQPLPVPVENADSSESEDPGDFFDHYLTGDEVGSSDSDDSVRNTSESVITIHQVGTLVRDKERLMELSDCYVMHLETTLYDLCLRRLRALGPSKTTLLSLPTKIVHDLKRLYYDPFGAENCGRKSTSG
ncbi:Kelch domain-containing protein 3 [Fasciola gigantica]|uniref:Kelch domain-containing protein 3 n=1 Tax=Fasciola gigantica TaxID=46835 RepID=A0A504YT77_FASGI|nr:Kelch domain-containing protein 3 [Fasciola gigantica]